MNAAVLSFLKNVEATPEAMGMQTQGFQPENLLLDRASGQIHVLC